MRIPLRLNPGLVAVAVLFLQGCASRPSIDYDQTFDFAVVKNFTIEDPVAAQTGDPRLDSPLINRRIHAAIASVMDRRGYSASTGSPDIRVHYYLGKRSGVETRDSGIAVAAGSYPYRRGGIGIGYGYPAYDVVSYEEGILTIDMISPADNRLVWRGSSSRRLGESGSTPETATKVVNEVVAEILDRFPPGSRQQ